MMMLSEPPETDYDLRLSAFGFPLRVSWTFWLGAIVIGYDFADGLDTRFGSDGPGVLPLLVLWTLCMFISIWIHELGHTFAFRYFGINSSIVLYHFGGLAIPNSSFHPGRNFSQVGEKANLIIALAGPVAQLLSAAVVIAAVKLAGYNLEVFAWMPVGLDKLTWFYEGKPIDSPGLFALVSFYIFPSVLWALLNLVPVWPLDGGQICRSIVLLRGGNEMQSLWISVITAIGLAVWAFTEEQRMMGFFFAMFAFSSYQMLQQPRGWR